MLITAASVVCVILVLARIAYSNSYGYVGLIWNLFLAWIPFALAYFAYILSWRKLSIYIAIPIFVFLWLIFFPNAPYILTDLQHLGQTSAGDSLWNSANVPIWYDVILLIWFSWTGMLLGIISLNLMQEIIRREFGRWFGWMFVLIVAGLSSAGIYVGRFIRLNSWDILKNPTNTAVESLGLAHRSQPSFIWIYRSLHIILYLCLSHNLCVWPPSARTNRRNILMPALIIIRGGGDLASGIALRLHRAGLNVAITELPQPLSVRQTVSFATAIYEKQITVEEVTARVVNDPADTLKILNILSKQQVPVLIDPDCNAVKTLRPLAIVDARMMKRAPEALSHRALLYLGLGPGFTAPLNCHAVIENRRGRTLGRVIWEGSTLKDTSKPEGDPRRVLHAPQDGVIVNHKQIGDHCEPDELIAEISGAQIKAHYKGVVPRIDPFWISGDARHEDRRR